MKIEKVVNIKNSTKFNIAVVSFAMLSMTACNENADHIDSALEPASIDKEQVQLVTVEDQISYLIAYAAAQEAAAAKIKLNPEVMELAISDSQNDVASRISKEDARIISMNFQRAIKENRIENVRATLIAKGDAFRKQNAQREGVVQTASGLQYEVLRSGDKKGSVPTLEDSVRVHYHGTLINGKVFDSSIDAGEPVVFGLTQVIRGWTEVLQLMSEGDKWKVVIPSELAYPNGTRNIQPGSTLIFEIELFEVL